MRKLAQLSLLLSFSGASIACAGSGSAPPTTVSGVQALDEEAATEEAGPAPDEDVVPSAARPFSGYRPADDRTFSDEEMLTFIASADAICIGERHTEVLDHYAELRLLHGLGARRELRGFELGLALEMVRTAEQPTLTALAEGKVDDEQFEELSNWKEEWGFPIQYYRPQLRFAAHHRVQLLGLGVDRELTREVAAQGISSLDDTKAASLPEFSPPDKEHRALFDGLMEGHPMESGQADNYYDAQLIWDEKMAELSSEWLVQRNSGRKLVIFAGTAHCHRTAIPARIARRTGLTVVSVLPIEGGSPKAISENPSTPDERMLAGYDYQMVFSR